jgi:hypothetical protein
MKIQPRADALALATHGRGFWILDDLAPLREMSGKVAGADQYLFTPGKSYLTPSFPYFRAISGAGKNPPSGVVVYYKLKQQPPKGKKVSLQFMTGNGKTIASFSNQIDKNGKPVERNKDFYSGKPSKQSGVVSAKAGLNEFVWNMRYPNAVKVPGAILWAGSMRGPMIVPGTYKVKLTVGKKSVTRNFTVKKNPNDPATQADLKAQLALLQKIHAKLNATDKAILKLRKVRDQINGYLDRLGDDAHATAIEKQANPIVAKLTSIEHALMQTKSHSNEDPLNYPIRMNNKLAALAGEVGRTFGRPTRQDRQVYQELAGQVDQQLQALHAAMQQQLPQLNRTIRQSGLPPISVSAQAGENGAGE